MFLFIGSIAACINFFSRILYSEWMSFSLSIVLAYCTGMVTAFVLSKVFVFKDSKQALGASAFYYILVNVVAILQTWGISMGLANYVFPAFGLQMYTKEIAHAIGLTAPIFTSYLGHKYFSFRTR